MLTKTKKTRPRDEEQGLMTPPSTSHKAIDVYGTFSTHGDALVSITLLHQALHDPNIHLGEIREYFPDFNGDPITLVSPEVSTFSFNPTEYLAPQPGADPPVASSVYPDDPASSDRVTAFPGRLQPTEESFASDYAVVRTLKRNNEGPVHLVRQRRTGKQFIIKQMRYIRTSDGMQIDPEEVYMMTQIRHHHRSVINVVEIIDDWARGISNMVLEFCSAGDAENLILSCQEKGQRVPGPIVLSIAAGLLDATAFLHHGDIDYDAVTSKPVVCENSRQKSILHRDIKPGNIFLRWGDNNNYGLPAAVLADFGMACIQEQQHSNSRCGTKAYWGPEVFQGACSDKSDMYAIGVTLFQLITGLHYVSRLDDIQEAFNCSTVKDQPQFLQLLETCLSPDPNARPAANELHRTSHVFKQHIKEWYENGGRIADDFWPVPFANDEYLPTQQPQPQPESVSSPPHYSQISSLMSPNAPSMTDAIANLPPLRRMNGHSDLQVAGGAEYAQEIADIPGPFRSPLPSAKTENGVFQTDEDAQAAAGAQAPRSCFSWGSDSSA